MSETSTERELAEKFDLSIEEVRLIANAMVKYQTMVMVKALLCGTEPEISRVCSDMQTWIERELSLCEHMGFGCATGYLRAQEQKETIERIVRKLRRPQNG